MFGSFGLKAAAGRLLTAGDDAKPGAHPYAVISYDYWTRRFGRDPKAIGRTFRAGNQLYQIVGVAPKDFTGTGTGTLTDLFVPTMMNAKVIGDPNWGWFRTWIRMALGARAAHVARRVTADVFAMSVCGGIAGLAAGVLSERYLRSLLFEVKATDAAMLAAPALTIFAAALCAAIPPVLRAVRIDPALTLRDE
jgi:hypothetical protein